MNSAGACRVVEEENSGSHRRPVLRTVRTECRGTPLWCRVSHCSGRTLLQRREAGPLSSDLANLSGLHASMRGSPEVHVTPGSHRDLYPARVFTRAPATSTIEVPARSLTANLTITEHTATPIFKRYNPNILLTNI